MSPWPSIGSGNGHVVTNGVLLLARHLKSPQRNEFSWPSTHGRQLKGAGDLDKYAGWPPAHAPSISSPTHRVKQPRRRPGGTRCLVVWHIEAAIEARRTAKQALLNAGPSGKAAAGPWAHASAIAPHQPRSKMGLGYQPAHAPGGCR